ncbi:MAG: sodium:calcium antiporter [Steroidobacteraceae bacterium]
MTSLLLALGVALVMILVASELFTNALEHLGQRLSISDGVTGSIFAAVGTALPEVTVPLLSLFAGTADRSLNEEIGVGAILGAPLMLSTLTTCLMTLAVIDRRGALGHVRPEYTGFVRDLNAFLLAFGIAAAAMYVPPHARYARGALSAVLVAIYLVYIFLTLRASGRLVQAGHGTKAAGTLLLARSGLTANWITVIAQLLGGVVLLVWGAKRFIAGVEGVSHVLGISALLLSLLIIPIATELPEKVNSILWIRRGKDTLAFGNITGAMVFQGTLLPAIGIMLTPWQPRIEVLTGVALTLLAGAWLRIHARPKGVAVWALTVNGILYAAFLAITLAR